MSYQSDRPKQVTLRFLAAPTDVNIYGKVHGGAVMKWIDEAAYACSVGWCRQLCVTVYVGGIRFYKPVLAGNLMEVYARLIYTGRTSMHIAVDVWANDPLAGTRVKTTHCISVFVAVDEKGTPVPVPAWQPETEEDIALRDYAVKLMDLRKGVEEEMSRYSRE